MSCVKVICKHILVTIPVCQALKSIQNIIMARVYDSAALNHCIASGQCARFQIRTVKFMQCLECNFYNFPFALVMLSALITSISKAGLYILQKPKA